MLRLRAGLVGDERGPLLGQPHELVRRVVEAGVHAVLEVGRRRDLHLLLLLGEHLGMMSGGCLRSKLETGTKCKVSEMKIGLTTRSGVSSVIRFCDF